MILLFGEKAHRTAKKTNTQDRPLEFSGILAMNKNNSKSLFEVNEYDSCEFSFQTVVDYTAFGPEGCGGVGFMSDFSDAYSALSSGDCGFASFSGCDCSCSSGSFSSVC